MLVVVGVSGLGTITFGLFLASRIGAEFADADWFHPAANVEKMHRVPPLTDDDSPALAEEYPILAAIAARPMDLIDPIIARLGRAVLTEPSPAPPPS